MSEKSVQSIALEQTSGARVKEAERNAPDGLLLGLLVALLVSDLGLRLYQQQTFGNEGREQRERNRARCEAAAHHGVRP